jgi:hypothetical protein
MVMKIKYIILSFGFIITSLTFVYSQDTKLVKEYDEIKTELVQWDSVRGEWLSNSLLAMAQNNPIPERTFPEDFTPFEMYSVIPFDRKEKLRTISDSRRNDPTMAQNSTLWLFVSEFFSRSTCRTTSGRTYGDPHFSSFDGNSFSLQSVGEFTLVQSQTGYVNVQARQTANGGDFSFNTAIAMNVGGDRLCFYANEKPDSDISTPIRLEGAPIHVITSTYFLPHGGTVRSKGNDYIVTWPTGEKVTLQMSNNLRFRTMNISTFIYPCVMGGYEGLLGNANGSPKDDLSIRGNNNSDLYASMSKYSTIFGDREITQTANKQEKDYLDRLTREFGSSWRITDLTSLFDYGIGQNTASFTDVNFPVVHRTVGDLSTKQRANASRKCQEMGITGEELRGCIFDNAYLNIPPSPRPVLVDQTHGVVLTKIPVPVRVDNRPVLDPVINGTIDRGNSKPVIPLDHSIDAIENKVNTPQTIPSNTEKPTPTDVKHTEEIKIKEPVQFNPTIFGESQPASPASKPSKQNRIIIPAEINFPSKTPSSKPSRGSNSPVSIPADVPVKLPAEMKIGG